jgi:hypothetical protein
MAMEKEKRAYIFLSVSFIQFADQFRAQVHQRVVFRRGLGRVRQIGDERKVQIGIVVAEESYL